MESLFSTPRATIVVIVIQLLVVSAGRGAGPSPTASEAEAAAHGHWCGYESPAQRRAQRSEAIVRGEIADPAMRRLPPVDTTRAAVGEFPNGEACLSTAHFFPFEDSNQLLVQEHTFAQLEELTTEAANALLAEHGERYDFIGFWMNFSPANQFGLAFYNPLFNTTTGIGDTSTDGFEIFDDRTEVGLASQRVEGYIMMFDVFSPWWGIGGTSGDFTRLALSHELEHRWAMYLPPVVGERPLQGDMDLCGRTFHWNFKVDGQGSAMEISEWLGSNPAQLIDAFTSFNVDTGGVFSYPDLYLMGYVTPQEMDAGGSEFRYMDNSNCSSDYDGPIRSLTSADIISTAGPRVPDMSSAPKDFRTGWIMIHQPGAPPTHLELRQAMTMLSLNQADWYDGTLERGTMNHQLFDDCDCNGSADIDEIESGAARDTNGNGLPDHCELNCGTSDCDQDGVIDTTDNCILLSNADQADQDGDAVGDLCDNCLDSPNASQQDGDEDGVGDTCDNCAIAANPLQQPAPLGQMLRARLPIEFCWELTTDVVWRRGDLSQVATYITDPPMTVAGTHCQTDAQMPAPGEGYFYVVRPDCSSSSWQSSPGVEPGRDLAWP